MNNIDAVPGAVQQMHTATVSLPPELKAQDREVIQAVKAVNSSELFGQNSELTFVLDRNTHRPVVRVIDRKTKEVLMQVPAEQVLRMAEDQMKAERADEV